MGTYRQSRGFTLVEVITVVVIVGIVSAVGVGFIVSMTNSYNKTQMRSKLVNKGRLVVEQVSRQLRASLPYSVRISASGRCLEFMPLVAGTNYLSELPDDQNGAPLTSSISTATFTLGRGAPEHVVVGALGSSEIYTTATPSSRATVGVLSSGSFTAVPLSSAHRFIRNSLSQRIFIADDPLRFCFISGASGSLVRYSGYGLNTSAISDSVPAGSSATIMALGVSDPGTVFSLSPGGEDRNVLVNFSLTFNQNSESITLDHKVLIRNTP